MPAIHHSNVLVVDDERLIRNQLSNALASRGINCDCAVDGEDALLKVARHKYDLVITDLRMPELNGHMLAIKLLYQVDRPKIIALTGVTDPRLTRDLLARGVDDVVYKPVNFYELADRLKVLLNPSQSLNKATSNSERGEQTSTVDTCGFVAADQLSALRDELENQLLESCTANAWMTAALRWIDWNGFPNPSIELKEFLNSLSRPAPLSVSERRKESRVPLNETALAITLDHRFEPIGVPFKLLARDLSKSGIGLVHTQQLNNLNLAIMWHARKKGRLIVAAHVVRCKSFSNFYEVGSKLIAPPYFYN